MDHTRNFDSVQPSAPLTPAVQGSAVLFYFVLTNPRTQIPSCSTLYRGRGRDGTIRPGCTVAGGRADPRGHLLSKRRHANWKMPHHCTHPGAHLSTHLCTSVPAGRAPHPCPGRRLTHHSLGESAELHVVGGENRLLVALDEGRLLSDQPQPVLQTRTHVTARPRGPLGGGDGRGGHTHRVDDDGDAPGLGRF